MIACVRVPYFALRVALFDRPQLDGEPLVLAGTKGNIPIVTECTPEATARGVRPGMKLREATSLCPGAIVISPNTVRDAFAFERIVERLEEISPLVEVDKPGCCYVDLRGLDRHFAGPLDTAQHVVQAVPAILRPRVGVSSGKFAAWVATGRAKPGRASVIDPADVRSFLAPADLAWLPLPSATLTQMKRLGLRSLGDLAALPGAAVTARFGAEGYNAWLLANGRGADKNDRVLPRKREEIVVEKLTLPAPTAARELVLFALKRLIVRAFDRPALNKRCVRQVRLRAVLEEHRSWEQMLTLREPYGRDRLIEALQRRLQTLELPEPVEELILELSGLVAESGRQEAFAGWHRQWPHGLVESARHLKQRYGASPLYRIVEVEPWSRIPERRYALISYEP